VSLSPFQRLLEDVLREEISILGVNYDEVIQDVTRNRDGETYTVRFQGELHDLEIVEPHEMPTPGALGAQLRRKLETLLKRCDSTG
jgi:hypothetical protein